MHQDNFFEVEIVEKVFGKCPVSEISNTVKEDESCKEALNDLKPRYEVDLLSSPLLLAGG
jgi:hypothetical protein